MHLPLPWAAWSKILYDILFFLLMRKHADCCHYCGDLGSISCGAELVRVLGHAIIMCGGLWPRRKAGKARESALE